MRGGAHRIGELADVGMPSDLCELARGLECLPQGDHVDREIALGELQNRLEQELMAPGEEVLRPERFCNVGNSIGVEQQSSEDAALGHLVMRRDPAARCFVQTFHP